MSPRKTTPKQPASEAPKQTKPPPRDEREIEAEEIDLNRALREANRPIPGSLGGDFKP